MRRTSCSWSIPGARTKGISVALRKVESPWGTMRTASEAPVWQGRGGGSGGVRTILSGWRTGLSRPQGRGFFFTALELEGPATGRVALLSPGRQARHGRVDTGSASGRVHWNRLFWERWPIRPNLRYWPFFEPALAGPQRRHAAGFRSDRPNLTPKHGGSQWNRPEAVSFVPTVTPRRARAARTGGRARQADRGGALLTQAGKTPHLRPDEPRLTPKTTIVETPPEPPPLPPRLFQTRSLDIIQGFI